LDYLKKVFFLYFATIVTHLGKIAVKKALNKRKKFFSSNSAHPSELGFERQLMDSKNLGWNYRTGTNRRCTVILVLEFSSNLVNFSIRHLNQICKITFNFKI
jgi:hypothetical protein